jgi:hypothetical protein
MLRGRILRSRHSSVRQHSCAADDRSADPSCRWLRLLDHHSQAQHDRSVGRERSLAVQNANEANIRAYNEALLMPSRGGARSGTVDKLAKEAMLRDRGRTISVTCEAHPGIMTSPSP